MSLFRLHESYDYDNNQVYLEEGYYDFDEIADWVLENLDESVLLEYKKALKNRRERAVKNLATDKHDSDKIDIGETSKKSLESFGKNKHYQRMLHRSAKANARNNIHYDMNKKIEAGGQALPTKNNIRHVDIGNNYDKNKIFDHEVGHTHQFADAYRKGGTRGIFKLMDTEAKLNGDKHTKKIFTSGGKNISSDDVNRSGYYKSSLEHNANKFADQGNSKEVSKERNNIVNTYLKGTNRARQLNANNSGMKNALDQAKLANTKKNK